MPSLPPRKPGKSAKPVMFRLLRRVNPVNNSSRPIRPEYHADWGMHVPGVCATFEAVMDSEPHVSLEDIMVSNACRGIGCRMYISMELQSSS